MWTLLFACAHEPDLSAPTQPPTEPVPAEPIEATPSAEPAEPTFSATLHDLTQAERTAMTDVTWKPGCPVSLDELVRIEALHHDFEGGVSTGSLIVRRTVADDVVAALQGAFAEGFPIERMEPIVAYQGSDQRSMNANNTSAFNCRPVTGGNRYSEHSYGHAIDVNPAQNPYVSASGRTILPDAARDYLDRENTRQGMLQADSAFVTTLVAAGWGWGGTWTRTRDYQHLSENGR